MLNIRPLQEYSQPLAKLTPELLFRVFNDTDFSNLIVNSISLYVESTVETAKEIWLRPIRTVSSNECRDMNNQLIEYFQTPRFFCVTKSNNIVF